jgi:hypothetical protein
MQRKTQRPVQFEINEHTRDAVANWIASAHLRPEQFLFPEPGVEVTTPFNPPIFSDRRVMGGGDWIGPERLRDALTAAHQGHVNLSPDQESPSGPTPAEAHEA